jgi:hypothetical protein
MVVDEFSACVTSKAIVVKPTKRLPLVTIVKPYHENIPLNEDMAGVLNCYPV